MTNQENKYNGWTNYATWRINLEMFDGWDSDGQEVTADSLQEIAEDHLSFEIDDGGRSRIHHVTNYVRRFLCGMALNSRDGVLRL